MCFLIEEAGARSSGHLFEVGYIAQTHSEAERRFKEWLTRWEAAGLVVDKQNKDQLRYITLRGFGRNTFGVRVHFWSGAPDTIDNIRGPRLDLILVDEAGYVSHRVKFAVWPMGGTRKAKHFIVGTPGRDGCGFKWFRDSYLRGIDTDTRKRLKGYRSFKAPTESNPFVSRAYIQQLRMDFRDPSAPDVVTPEEREEFDGDFITDLGTVFRNVQGVFTLKTYREEGPGVYVYEDFDPHKTYVVGIDLGKHSDKTVVSVFCVETGDQVCVATFRGDYIPQLSRIHDIVRRYGKNSGIWCEGREGGEMMTEMLATLYQQRVRVVKWTKGGEWDKESSVIRGQTLFQSAHWHLIDLPDQRREFTNYLKVPIGQHSNGFRYEAPDGEHDDFVAAALYAAYGLPLVSKSRPALPEGPEFGTYDWWLLLRDTQRLTVNVRNPYEL